MTISSPWPAAPDLDDYLDYRAIDSSRRWYGTWSRRCAARRLCPDPTALPVQRFLGRPPVPPPVPIPDDLPFDPKAYVTAHRALGLVLEVLDRRRPLIHLRSMLSPHAFRYVSVVTDWLPASALRGDARVLSIRMCQPTEHVAEVAAVCRLNGRTRAVAARFEHLPGPRNGRLRWCCAVIQLG